MIKKTLTGPCGIKLHLDQSKFNPDDPGEDTPALVEYKRHWGTYHFAINEGEVDLKEIPEQALEWLESDAISAEVEAVFEPPGC